MLGIVFRVLIYFVFLALIIFSVGTLIIRYVIPFFSAAERQEGRIYEKWKKFWRIK